ncbi:MAG: hypothetical protein EHM48_06555 [Planctomycetaceae bacterium]|nr:MAG: hypothetical protein EHM48_06555 [Planctomycetaceae bacterium]
MATIEQFQERLRRAIRETVQKCLAEGDLPEAQEGEARFTTIEALALAAGDAVSLEVFEQQLAESGMGPPHCPRCGFEGQRVRQRERKLQTRRGLEVPLREQECYCPGCRRAFFPSVQSAGAGRGL